MNTTEKPAAFRRLCVETASFSPVIASGLPQPPSGGCVLKQSDAKPLRLLQPPSRLQAAVC